MYIIFFGKSEKTGKKKTRVCSESSLLSAIVLNKKLFSKTY